MKSSFILRGLCGLVDALGFIPNSREFPPPRTQVLQSGSFRASIAASFAPVPVVGGSLKSHFRIKDCKSFVSHTATMPDCEGLCNPVCWSGCPVGNGPFGEKSAFFAVSIAPYGEKVNRDSVKRILFCSEGNHANGCGRNYAVCFESGVD